MGTWANVEGALSCGFKGNQTESQQTFFFFFVCFATGVSFRLEGPMAAGHRHCGGSQHLLARKPSRRPEGRGRKLETGSKGGRVFVGSTEGGRFVALV